jgi:tRNA pseudouridine13 synthase
MIESVIAEDGVTLEHLRLRGLKEMFFSRGSRAILCIPDEVNSGIEADVLNKGKSALRLGFVLPRGAYATLIVKRIAQLETSQAPSESEASRTA